MNKDSWMFFALLWYLFGLMYAVVGFYNALAFLFSALRGEPNSLNFAMATSSLPIMAIIYFGGKMIDKKSGLTDKRLSHKAQKAKEET
jgi:hypothetical protein